MSAAGIRAVPSAAARAAASDTIARCTHGDGAGHVAEAQRGVLKAPPRRWLQGISFGADGSVAWPRRRITVCLDGDAGASPGAATEDGLFGAYLVQADTLLLQLLRDPPAVAAAPPDVGALVRSPEGQSLRWFALAGLATGGVSEEGCWDMAPAISALPPVEGGGTAIDARAWGGVGHADLWLQPTAPAVAILERQHADLSPEEVAAWDGEALPAALDEAAPSAAGASAARPPPAASAARVPRAAKASSRGGLFRSPATTLVAASTAEPESSAGAPPLRVAESSSEVDAAVSYALPVPAAVDASTVTDDAASATASTPTCYSGGGTLPAEHVAVRRAAQAGLAALPVAPPKLLKSLTRGMGLGLAQFGMIRDGDRVLVGLSGGKDSLTMLVLLLGLQVQ